MQSTRIMLSVTLLIATFVAPLQAWSQEPASGQDQAAASQASGKLPHLHRRTESDTEELSQDEMLTDLRDMRLCLSQVKQQAVNMFLEATRTRVLTSEPALVSSPKVISKEMIFEKAQYLPPRKEWLVFYMNTLEPLVQLLTEDLADVDTNERKVPPAIETRVNPLWKTWKSEVLQINKLLDQVQEAIGDPSGGNVALAKASVAIFDQAEELESVRYKVAVIFREEYAKTNAAKSKK